MGSLAPRPNILLVDDDPVMIQILAAILSDVATLRFATSGATALRLARETAPDLILLDAQMPGMSGLEVCGALKADANLVKIPVIFVTGQAGPEFELATFEMGAADFIAKPFSAPLVVARVKTQLRVKHLTDELRRIAAVDPLTQVANRRSFDETLDREWRRLRRGGDSMALAIIDVDHFKLFNDAYGHPAGDAALCSVAAALRRVCQRPADMVARIGGEEFAVLLPNTDVAGAIHIATALVAAVAAINMPHHASPTAEHVTISVGLATHQHDEPLAGASAQSGHWARPAAPRDLVAAADAALYEAKHAGRCRAHARSVADHMMRAEALPEARQASGVS